MAEVSELMKGYSSSQENILREIKNRSMEYSGFIIDIGELSSKITGTHSEDLSLGAAVFACYVVAGVVTNAYRELKDARKRIDDGRDSFLREIGKKVSELNDPANKEVVNKIEYFLDHGGKEKLESERGFLSRVKKLVNNSPDIVDEVRYKLAAEAVDILRKKGNHLASREDEKAVQVYLLGKNVQPSRKNVNWLLGEMKDGKKSIYSTDGHLTSSEMVDSREKERKMNDTTDWAEGVIGPAPSPEVQKVVAMDAAENRGSNRSVRGESPEELVADIGKIAEAMAHDQKPLSGADKSAPEKGPESTSPDQPTSTVPPRPKREPIGDLRPEALSGKQAQDPYHPVRFYDEKGRHVMTDEGRQLNIRARASTQEKVLLAALQEGKERFGEPVRIAGNPIFMARMARLAVEQGIDIAPDGPFKAIAERERRLAQARTLGHNEISASAKAPEIPSEPFKPQVGANNVTVRSVQENGAVVTRAGRDQFLPLENAQQCETLKQFEGQAAVLHFGKDGRLQGVSAPQKARGREQARPLA